jgi:hypothetical protein
MKKITLILSILLLGNAFAQNEVTVETSQNWLGYVNAFDVSNDAFAFGFAYGAADLRATATATSMTLEPNIAIWTGEATNAAWFDQGAATQTAVKYIEASSYIENNALAGSDLTFSGNVSVSDLGSEYTVVAFVKALDPNAGYATVVNNTVDISSTGDYTVSATAAELASGFIIQYGFAVTGPLADPADTTLGSVVIGNPPTSGLEDNVLNAVKMFPNPAKDYVRFSTNSNEDLDIQIFDMLGKAVLRVDNVRNAVNVSELNSGLYFVQMTLGAQKSTKKLVIN